MGKSSKATYILLSCILLVAAALRLIHPFNIPYTGDEFNALLRTHFKSFSDLIENGVIIDAHPAGVQVFLYYWTKLFGYSELVVKIPFIICGILSVLFIFLLAREWFNNTVGIVSASFLATIQYTVMYSQIARPYASGLLFTLAMVYYWSKFVFKPQENPYRNLMLYILFSALCAYNHYFTLLVAAMVGFTGLFFIQRKQLRFYIGAGLLIFVLYIPHLRIFFYQLGIGGIEHLGKPGNNFIIDYIKYVFQFSTLIYASIVCLLLFGITKTLRGKKLNRLFLGLSLCWFLIPFVIGFFYSRYAIPVLQYSVLIFSFPFLLLFLFGWLPEMSIKMKTAIVILICGINIFSLASERKHYSIFYNNRYQQIVTLTDSAHKALGPDSCISLIQSGAEMPEGYYVRKEKIDSSYFTYLYDTLSRKELIKSLETERKPYLSFGCLASADPLDFAILSSYYPYTIRRSDFYGGTFYLLSKRSTGHTPQQTYISVNDFEQSYPDWSSSDQKYISDSISFSGKHSYKMDSLNEWGPSYTCALDKITSSNYNFITVDIEILPLENLNDVYIVSSFESAGKTIDWRSTPLSDFITYDGAHRWQKAYHSIKLSDINLDYAHVTAKIYIWNKGKKNFYLDDFKVRTFEGNPIIYGLFKKV